MKKTLMAIIMALCVTLPSLAQSNSDKVSIGVGALYERGLDATLSWEHETKYHNAWEFFANGYVKWKDCESCGHVCPESFWNTIAHGESVQPTNHVCGADGTTMAV